MGYDFITGPELVRKFRSQLIHSNYIDHLIGEVDAIETVEGAFKVTTSDLDTYTARALIIATGMVRRRLDVPGEETFQRKGIFYGNLQDLSFVQGEDVVVVGGGNSAMQIVDNLSTVARRIHIVARGQLTADRKDIERVAALGNVRRYEAYKVERFAGGDALSEVHVRKLAGGVRFPIPAKGAFIAIGLRPNTSLVEDFVDLNERGEIVIGPDCSTRCPGLFAAGDVTSAYGKRIIIASGEGAKAALSAKRYTLRLRRKARSRAKSGS